MSWYVLPTCPVCLDTEHDHWTALPCGHIFHQECIIQCMKSQKPHHCPTCRETFGAGKRKGWVPLRMFGVMKEQGVQKDNPTQACSEDADTSQVDSSQKRLMAQEAFVMQMKLSEYKSKISTLEDDLQAAHGKCEDASTAAKQFAVEAVAMIKRVKDMKAALRAVQDKRDALDRESEKLKETLGLQGVDLGKFAAQITSLQAAKQKEENEHTRQMFAEAAQISRLERQLKVANARNSKTKLPLEEMAGLLGDDRSAWLDVLSVSRNSESLLVAETETLRRQIATQTGAMSELAESNASQMKALEGEKRTCKIQMLQLEYKLSTLEGEAAAAAVAAKEAQQLAACAAALRQPRVYQQHEPHQQQQQQQHHHQPHQQQQSKTSQWQQFQNQNQNQHRATSMRDSASISEAVMPWLSARDISEDAAVRAQVAAATPFTTTTPNISASPHLPWPSTHKPHTTAPVHPAAEPWPASLSSTPPLHVPNTTTTRTATTHQSANSAAIDLTATPPHRRHPTVHAHSSSTDLGHRDFIPASQPHHPNSGRGGGGDERARERSLSEGEEDARDDALDQLSSLMDAGFASSDGDGDEENAHGEGHDDGAGAEYRGLVMGQMDLPPSPLPAIPGQLFKGQSRLVAGLASSGGVGPGHYAPVMAASQKRLQEGSFVGRVVTAGVSGTLIRDGPDGRGGNVRLLGGAGYSMGGKRVTNTEHHVNIPNKKSTAVKTSACRTISSFFKKTGS